MISWAVNFSTRALIVVHFEEVRFVACTSQFPTPGNRSRKMTPIIDRRQKTQNVVAAQMLLGG